MKVAPIEFMMDVAVGRRPDGSAVYVRDLVSPLRSISGGAHTYGNLTRTISRGDMMTLAYDTITAPDGAPDSKGDA